MIEELTGLGIDPRSCTQCLEYGCGTGRVTRYLAELFPNVVGMDVSVGHLELARSYLDRQGITNVDLRAVTGAIDDALPSCDFLYTRLVLQHNPPPAIAATLERLLATIRPGGVGVFQLLTHIQGYTFRVADYLKRIPSLNDQELHPLPQAEVLRIVANQRCRPVLVYRDDSIGRAEACSERVIVVK